MGVWIEKNKFGRVVKMEWDDGYVEEECDWCGEVRKCEVNEFDEKRCEECR